ncbi:unnamed protein product [Calypogeia fissa]
MTQLSLSAPILAGAQLQVCHNVAHDVRLSRSPEFLGCSCSSNLCIGRVARPAPGWGRTAPHRSRSMLTVKAIGDPSQSTFLSLEEAGLIEMTNLDMHEKFLARLTVSSLNLLREISEQERIPIEELNAGKLCDWFVRDKEKRENNIDEATLKWNTHEW